ncbi:MerC family mercury resistance protein [Granulicella sp. 5B5]|uniref:MerC domain-containing protein n=1 Tax=Granulicella sp. 5B5 TaxID=1617967 RepID=UPI0015F75BE5|nr:MerC domain-containing protein [Granulicella sp. 5B5]QMV19456.1 MerC family mercury resistance protein [Granulicella sp. 5B5]
MSLETTSSTATTWPDRAGIWASALCVVHCLLTPILFSLSAVFVHFLPSDEKVHRFLALAIALLGALALVRGFRKHRRVRVVCTMTGGLACIFLAAFTGDRLPGHWAEVGITFVGSVLMISAHRMNHTFCKDCSCSSR